VQHTGVTFFVRLLGMAWRRTPPSPFAAGVDALERGRHDEALAHFATALARAETAGERSRIENKRALTLLARRDRPAAVAALAAALAWDPRCVAAIVNIGNLLLEDGVVDDAVAHYEAALRIDDGYAPAHLNLGIAYKRMGRRADAVREFRRASRIEGRLRPLLRRSRGSTTR